MERVRLDGGGPRSRPRSQQSLARSCSQQSLWSTGSLNSLSLGSSRVNHLGVPTRHSAPVRLKYARTYTIVVQSHKVVAHQGTHAPLGTHAHAHAHARPSLGTRSLL
jgi:hypothetical protein